MYKETLTLDTVTTSLSGSNKHEIISSLLDLLCKTGKVSDRQLALNDLLEHESAMSTGMEHGIAIPHAKSDSVEELVACVGVSRKKIDFECLDRKPAQIFIMTLSPKGSTGPHVRFLAEMSQLLKDAKLRKRILKAKSDKELLEILQA
ncbi:PTS sugar transporter subunit IIA [Spirochaeta dissipatitropha]